MSDSKALDAECARLQSHVEALRANGESGPEYLAALVALSDACHARIAACGLVIAPIGARSSGYGRPISRRRRSQVAA